jgi:aminocarboxymuconate-semialdehyde decarboxylase
VLAVVDVHAHLVPRSLHAETNRRRLPHGLLEPDALVAWLDANGVEQALVSTPPLLLGAGLGTAQAAGLNDELAELVCPYLGRLRPLAHLPMADPKGAEAEARRCHAQPWAGVVVVSSTPGLTLDDPAFDGLWSALEDGDGRFVLVHPVDAPDPRLDRFYLTNLLGNPYETALAAACLVFADVPARFPGVRFCLAHAGGATAMVAGRWEQGYETRRPGLERRLALPPREAVRRLFADTVAHSSAALELAAEVFGAEHVLLGSDWPFPMGELEPAAHLSGRFAPDVTGANSQRAVGSAGSAVRS